MALITLMDTIAGATNPNIGDELLKFPSIKNWWSLDREGFSGNTLTPRIGNDTLAVGADPLVFERNYGFDFPRGDGVILSQYLTGLFTPPSRVFTVASIQRMEATQTEPWGLGFNASTTSSFRFRPVPRSANGSAGYGLYGVGGLNAISTFAGVPGAAVGSTFVYLMTIDLTLADTAAGPVSLKCSVNGGLIYGQADVALPAAQPLAAKMRLDLLRASHVDAFSGPVMDALIIDGDISAQPELLAEINTYADRCYINYGA